MYGPGDSATWPAYIGLPNDPREPDEETDLDMLIAEEDRPWPGECGGGCEYCGCQE